MTPQRAGQLPFDYSHQPSFLEDDFIEGDGNRLALAHIRAFPDWSAPLTLLQGAPKSGKSHLAMIWARRAGALEIGPQMIARAALDRTRPVLLDDVDRAGFNEADLFHLLNQSIRDRRPMLITAREAIANWPFQTDDLKSRARLAASFRLEFGDDIQLTQMLVKLFSDRQVSVDAKVVDFMVARMSRSPEEAVALAELSDTLALARGSAITRRVAADALAQRGVALAELDLEGDEDE